jgi:hypothetical protein
VGRDVILGPVLLLGARATAALAGPMVGERAVFGLDAAGAFGAWARRRPGLADALAATALLAWLAGGALTAPERRHAAVAWTLAALGVTGPFVVADALGRVPG